MLCSFGHNLFCVCALHCLFSIECALCSAVQQQDAFIKRFSFTTTRENELQVEVPFEYLSKEEMSTEHGLSELLVRVREV